MATSTCLGAGALADGGVTEGVGAVGLGAGAGDSGAVSADVAAAVAFLAGAFFTAGFFSALVAPLAAAFLGLGASLDAAVLVVFLRVVSEAMVLKKG